MDNNAPATSIQAGQVKLAFLDWGQASLWVIKRELPEVKNRGTLATWRKSAVYKQTYKAIQDEFQTKMLKLPGSQQLREEIQMAYVASVRRLYGIIVDPKSSDKTVISASTLIAKLAGALRDTPYDPETIVKTEGVADELRKALGRHDTIQ